MSKKRGLKRRAKRMYKSIVKGQFIPPTPCCCGGFFLGPLVLILGGKK